jgi:thiamine biosynthesis lipoprotein
MTVLLDTHGRTTWQLWGTYASLAVTDASLLAQARDIVDGVLADIDRACNRFRLDSELTRLTGRTSGGVVVSATLTALLRVALDAAELTDGDVDPTVGRRLIELGYDRDLDEVRHLGRTAVSIHRLPAPVPGWRQVTLERSLLIAPDAITLDLGATAKAYAADLAAASVTGELGCGVLISLGGDIATAGAREEGPWQVLVQDLPSDPVQQVSLTPGWALATSSTQHRRWGAGGRQLHHILDPRSGLPVSETWRTASVVARTCAVANALSTAAIVRGIAAGEWLGQQNVAARLVDAERRVHPIGTWPAQAESTQTAEGELHAG